MSIDKDLLSAQIFGANISFGIGAVDSISTFLQDYDSAKPLIVTDKGIVKAGLVNVIKERLDASGIGFSLFDGVQPNPIDRNVMECLREYHEEGCDSIIGLGGGSPMDVAKAMGVMACHPGHVRDYFYNKDKLTSKRIPTIAIPTTSGTGTEVSRAAVITDTVDNRKKLVFTGPATLALVDPYLTLNLSPLLTAATGIDALCHSIEAYVSSRYNPFAGAIAIAGIKLVAENLREAVKNGHNIEARKNMSMSSTMGALAFYKGLGAVHSLAHQLSTVANIPHGVANAIILPHVMEFNVSSAVDRYIDIAKAMGVNTWEMSQEQAARASVDSVSVLCRDIGLPERLHEVGVSRDSIPEMAKMAMEDHCHLGNPRVCNYESMIDLYNAAF
ncbi:iron-containing alcohol dehydrogenase [Candidatus Poribacteria bacterium]|nr:iron-containing alcohol dehydrogenase [Candidatus Poribacteria bacterium]